jgi:hypothetical protein
MRRLAAFFVFLREIPAPIKQTGGKIPYYAGATGLKNSTAAAKTYQELLLCALRRALYKRKPRTAPRGGIFFA